DMNPFRRDASPQASEEAPPQAAPRRVVAPVAAPAVGRSSRKRYRAPHPSLLTRGVPRASGPEMSQTVLRGNARLLEDVLADFGVKGDVREIRPGPVITLFEFEPARGVKASRVIGLADDIARSMSAKSARIAVVPGCNTLGIELPNAERETVALRDIIETPTFLEDGGRLPIALGKAIEGTPVVVDLARMPHLLVAGTTGSGKSVGVNAMIMSLLFTHPPSDLRLLMIDPKMLELSVYNGIPHLLTPVVTDPQKAIAALNWAIREMEDRYKRMADLGVRNIAGYNARLEDAAASGERLSQRVQTGFDRETDQAIYEDREVDLTPMPNIVIVVDEFADLMAVAGKDIEAAVQRLAQMARAAGIHIVMATQRPSVDVVTGTIKANFPSRIGFRVASKIDSRTIINEHGAEQLLGHGDMLLSDGSGRLRRVHGAFVSDQEVEAVAAFLRDQGEPDYVAGLTEAPEDDEAAAPNAAEAGDLFDKAVAIVMRDRKASTSYLQRRLQIGYNRAADLIERMEADGLIGPADHAGRRDILMSGRDG
ncbi:MAG: DNA translocase FtsK, partial [Pseudomonadota bacterium]